MIKAQFGILKWYENTNNRIWEKLTKSGGAKTDAIVILETNIIPALQLFVDSSTAATVELLDINGLTIGSPISLTVDDETTYFRLLYLGDELENNVDGFYSLKITNGAEYYYSDVFHWITNPDSENELMKFSISTYDLKIGDYLFDATDFDIEFYLNAKPELPKRESLEEATESNGVTTPYYSGGALIFSWILICTKPIYVFLLRFRELLVNGTISMSYEGDTFVVKDPIISVFEDTGDGQQVDVRIEIKPDNEIVKVINA